MRHKCPKTQLALHARCGREKQLLAGITFAWFPGTTCRSELRECCITKRTLPPNAQNGNLGEIVEAHASTTPSSMPSWKPAKAPLNKYSQW